MNTFEKLAILGQGAEQEHELTASQTAPSCFTPRGTADAYQRHRNPMMKGDDRFLSGSVHVGRTGSGKTFRLLKVLQTNICEFDCFYCEHRSGRDQPRTYVSPEELARTFMMLYRKGTVEGLFLSSGITRKIDTMQERMVQTAEILRTRHRFNGYLHLKILPGASRAAVERTMELASRVSLNLEAPTPRHLARLSVQKHFLDDMITRMIWIKQMKERNPRRIPSGHITQFVVGPAGETDRDLLTTTHRLYRELGLRRAYFSAFSPVRDTPLDDRPAVPLLRQHRLYQADWLMRFYGFSAAELVFDDRGLLPTEVDPKTAWATDHPEFFPIDALSAPYESLIRVPGIGPVSAGRLTELRGSSVITDPRQLSRLGIAIRRAAPFLLLRGRALALPRVPTRSEPSQLALW
jgi:predicted DNA-binding helix-hairpin-helix protein